MTDARFSAWPAETLFMCTAAGFFGFSILLGVTFQLPPIKALNHAQRILATSCIVAFANASIVAPFAISAFWDIWDSGASTDCSGGVNLARVEAPKTALYACGLTCGYFIVDAAILAIFPAESKKNLGASGVQILWVHHIVSLLVWPYAFMSSACVFFVVYFLATEVTNIGQNLFLLSNKIDLFPGGIVIGSLWALSFFVVRVVPVPWLVYAYCKLFLFQSCGLSTFQLVLGLVTVPIPMCLNLYWFYLIYRKAMSMLFGKQKKGKSESRELRKPAE
jgi:hypothetical protein